MDNNSKHRILIDGDMEAIYGGDEHQSIASYFSI
jgi:hypothetical protein